MAVNHFIEQSEERIILIDILMALMISLRSVKNKAILRNLPENEKNLVALLPNVTRWSGKFYMIERYFKLENAIDLAFVNYIRAH